LPLRKEGQRRYGYEQNDDRDADDFEDDPARWESHLDFVRIARLLPPCFPSRRYEWKIDPSQRVQRAESWTRATPRSRSRAATRPAMSTWGLARVRSTKASSNCSATSSPTSKQQTRMLGPSHAARVTPSVSEGPGGVGGAPPARPAPSLTLGVTTSSVASTIFCTAPRQPQWMFAITPSPMKETGRQSAVLMARAAGTDDQSASHSARASVGAHSVRPCTWWQCAIGIPTNFCSVSPIAPS